MYIIAYCDGQRTGIQYIIYIIIMFKKLVYQWLHCLSSCVEVNRLRKNEKQGNAVGQAILTSMSMYSPMVVMTPGAYMMGCHCL